MNSQTRVLFFLMMAFSMVGCATLTADAMNPITLSFHDGSHGTCVLKNKRGEWHAELPGTISVRKSDDPLVYQCTTADHRTTTGAIKSQINPKYIAGALFLDFGITDSITDKHRFYVKEYVIVLPDSEAKTETLGK